MSTASSTFNFIGNKTNKEPLYMAFHYIDNQPFENVAKDACKDFLGVIAKIFIG